MASSSAVESAPPETATTMVSPETGSLSFRHSTSNMRANWLIRGILGSIVIYEPSSPRSRHTLLKLSRPLLFRSDSALHNPTIGEQGDYARRKPNQIQRMAAGFNHFVPILWLSVVGSSLPERR